MENEFDVEVLSFLVLKELSNIWQVTDFLELLNEMEFGSTDGMNQDEIRDMCLLSLQDLNPEEAAALVLKYRLGDRLSAGQIHNIAADMPEEKLWEEYADMSFHEQLFNISSLLYQVSPKSFPEPDAVRATIRVTAKHETGREILQRAMNESFLVRLLAGGMDEDAALHRLFAEQLAADSFPEAELIIWTFSIESGDTDTRIVELTSSGSWLDPLRNTKSYSAHASPDKAAGLN